MDEDAVEDEGPELAGVEGVEASPWTVSNVCVGLVSDDCVGVVSNVSLGVVVVVRPAETADQKLAADALAADASSPA